MTALTGPVWLFNIAKGPRCGTVTAGLSFLLLFDTIVAGGASDFLVDQKPTE